MQMTASFFCRGLTPPPRWAGRRLSRPSLRWGLIDAFLKKAWQKSHSQINHASGIFLFILTFYPAGYIVHALSK